MEIVKGCVVKSISGRDAQRFYLVVKIEDGFVWIEILDDGVGFDVEQLQSSSFGGVGIKNLRYRLETLLKAKLEIQSEVGKGTKQVIQIPEQEAQLFDEDDDR